MKSESQIKPSWNFTVHNLDDLDVNRVLAEVPPEKLWCIIADKNGVPVGLFVRQSWLCKFEDADQVRVTDEPMRPNWGSISAPYLARSGSVLSQARHRYFTAPELPRGWRVSTACFKDTTLETVLSELEAAEKFRRRIPVRVYVGGNNA